MDSGTAVGDENGDEENETWEGPSARQRVWSTCCAFIAMILLIVGELMSEQNTLGVILIGGTLTVLNVLITASGLEKTVEDATEEGEVLAENSAYQTQSSTRRQALDMTSIDVDVDELPTEDERDTSHEDFDYDMLERMRFRPRLPSVRGLLDRWRYDADSEVEELKERRPKPKKRARRIGRVTEDDSVEERPPRRKEDVESFNRKRRTHKARREKHDRIERDKYRERDKREGRSRDKRHKKKKQVTIAPGSAERVIIGEV